MGSNPGLRRQHRNDANYVSAGIRGRELSTTDAKFDGIEAEAQADQTDAEIKIAYENNADNALTDAGPSAQPPSGDVAGR